MADDVKTGIRVSVEGKADFVKDLQDSADAMHSAKKAADGLQTSANNAENALDNLASGSASSTKTFEDNVSAAADQAVADFLNVIAVVLEVNAAIIANVNEVAEMGDAIAKGAKEIGFTAEAYQTWDFILKKNNSSIGKARGAIQNLTKVTETGGKAQSEAFEKIGLSMEQVQAMKPDELFSVVVAGLQNLQGEGERAAAASALFGGSYKNLGTLLSSTNQETAGLSDLARSLNAIMSEDAVKQAEEYQDTIENISTTIEGIKRTFGEGLMEPLAQTRDGLNDLLLAVNWQGLADALTNIYTPGIDFLNDFLIPFAKLNVTGITALLSGLSEVLSVIGDVIGGEKTLQEGLDELWLYDRDPLDLAVQFKDAPDTLAQIGSMSTALKDLQNNLTGIEEVDVKALADFDASVESYLTNVEALAEGSENAADANKFLEEQVLAVSAAYRTDALNMDGMDADKADEYAQALAAIYAQYQQLLQQPADPLADAKESADGLAEAAENVASNAETLLSTFPETTGEIVGEFESGADEMSQAAGKMVEDANATMSSNMAALQANAYVWGGDLALAFARGISDGTISFVVPAVDGLAGDIEDRIGFSEPSLGPLADFHTFAPDMMELFAQGIRDGEDLISQAIGQSFDLGPLIAGQASQSYNYGGVNVVIYGAEGQSADELYDVFSYRLQHEVADREAVFS